jgi:hypothetical protein
MRSACSVAALVALGAYAPSARGEDRTSPFLATATATEPAVRPTLVWFATQLLPSPQIAAGDGRAHFGLRWQVTPLLYSWGLNRKLSPWRVLVAEPYVRQSGAVELYLSPEYFASGNDFWDHWILRPGVRAYFPIVQHGEYLSVSLGTSFQRFQTHESAAFEGGIYALYGILGVQLSYAPAPRDPVATIVTLRFRYF